MNRNTQLVRAIVRADQEAIDRLSAELAAAGLGSPVAITGFAFYLAARQRFPSADIREVIHFVADARSYFLGGKDLPQREAEAIVLDALGASRSADEELLSGLSIDTIYLIQSQLLTKLVLDATMSEAELDAFLVEAERLEAEWEAEQAGT